MQTLRLDGIHVEVRGEGEPVLLIHGNAGDLHYFDRTVPELAQSFRVVAMDCRGQGRSARGTGPLTIQRMADDAAAVIRAVQAGDEPFHVVGFSDGANVAMSLAARHPRLVRSLVLNAGNITRSGLTARLRVALWFADRLLRMRHPVPVVHRERELIRLMLDQPGITTHDLAGIAVPTLVLAGSRDLVRRTHTRLIARSIPRAQLRIVRGGTHFVMRDMAVAANALVESFLRTGRAPLGDRARDR